MRAFLILSIDRRNTPAEAEHVVDLAIKYQSSGVVGVDLCGDPAKGDVRIFANAFARAKTHGLKMTLHFAETETSGCDVELSTLLSWKPDRLGHVIHVKEAFQKSIEEQNIGVELCLSCNVHAKMITGTYSDHHFGMWRHSSVPVALSVHALVPFVLFAVLILGRLTMLVSSAVLCRRSTIWPRSTFLLIVATSGCCVSEL
jgi:adenosine deaminase